MWEVEAVDAGVTLHDLLSDERRTVHETRGSRTLVARDAVLARIVDHDGVSLLCGVHPRPLPPVDAAEVVRRGRARLRRKRPVPADRLRDTVFGRNLIRYWEEAVEACDERRAIPPDLRNRDGDLLLLTVDHFEVAAGDLPAIEACVAELDGAHREPAGEDVSVHVFLRPDDPAEPDGEHTLVGRLRVGSDSVRIETNSIARADALRARVERACGSRLRHRAREHLDPRALARQPGRAPQPSPEEERLVTEFKKRHYADWLDQPLPALDHKTPRECVRTAAHGAHGTKGPGRTVRFHGPPARARHRLTVGGSLAAVVRFGTSPGK